MLDHLDQQVHGGDLTLGGRGLEEDEVLHGLVGVVQALVESDQHLVPAERGATGRAGGEDPLHDLGGHVRPVLALDVRRSLLAGSLLAHLAEPEEQLLVGVGALTLGDVDLHQFLDGDPLVEGELGQVVTVLLDLGGVQLVRIPEVALLDDGHVRLALHDRREQTTGTGAGGVAVELADQRLQVHVRGFDVLVDEVEGVEVELGRELVHEPLGLRQLHRAVRADEVTTLVGVVTSGGLGDHRVDPLTHTGVVGQALDHPDRIVGGHGHLLVDLTALRQHVEGAGDVQLVDVQRQFVLLDVGETAVLEVEREVREVDVVDAVLTVAVRATDADQLQLGALVVVDPDGGGLDGVVQIPATVATVVGDEVTVGDREAVGLLVEEGLVLTTDDVRTVAADHQVLVGHDVHVRGPAHGEAEVVVLVQGTAVLLVTVPNTVDHVQVTLADPVHEELRQVEVETAGRPQLGHHLVRLDERLLGDLVISTVLHADHHVGGDARTVTQSLDHGGVHALHVLGETVQREQRLEPGHRLAVGRCGVGGVVGEHRRPGTHVRLEAQLRLEVDRVGHDVVLITVGLDHLEVGDDDGIAFEQRSGGELLQDARVDQHTQVDAADLAVGDVADLTLAHHGIRDRLAERLGEALGDDRDAIGVQLVLVHAVRELDVQRGSGVAGQRPGEPLAEQGLTHDLRQPLGHLGRVEDVDAQLGAELHPRGLGAVRADQLHDHDAGVVRPRDGGDPAGNAVEDHVLGALDGQTHVGFTGVHEHLHVEVPPLAEDELLQERVAEVAVAEQHGHAVLVREQLDRHLLLQVLSVRSELGGTLDGGDAGDEATGRTEALLRELRGSTADGAVHGAVTLAGDGRGHLELVATRGLDALTGRVLGDGPVHPRRDGGVHGVHLLVDVVVVGHDLELSFDGVDVLAHVVGLDGLDVVLGRVDAVEAILLGLPGLVGGTTELNVVLHLLFSLVDVTLAVRASLRHSARDSARNRR